MDWSGDAETMQGGSKSDVARFRGWGVSNVKSVDLRGSSEDG